MSKEKILSAIRAGKPHARPLPDLPSFGLPAGNLDEIFTRNAKAGVTKTVTIAAGETIDAVISTLFAGSLVVASMVPGIPGSLDLEKVQKGTALQSVDLAVLPARFGVAENGAVWLDESGCGHRALPFIAQHLVVVLDRNNILPDMHEAYRRISVNSAGFGVFIAGPSKTADIEQSLVIGAQGARSLTVILTGKSS